MFQKEIQEIQKDLPREQSVTINGKITNIEKGSNSKKILLKRCHIFYKNKYLKVNKAILLVNESENTVVSSLKIGNTIEAKADYKLLSIPTNEGGFNEKQYYYSLGIFVKLQTSADKIKVNKPDRYSYVKNTLYIVRENAAKRIYLLCKKKYAAIFVGMLLGDKSDIDEETNTLYKLAGISHLLAISGLHISAIGMFIFKLLRKKYGYYPSVILSIMIVVLYGIMTGNSISTRRAVIMFIINMIAAMLGRTYDIRTSLSFAFLILIVENPYSVRNSGLILSFGAILALILLYETIIKFLRVKNKIFKAVLSGISINICTRPAIVCYYYEFPLYSSIVNMIIIPLSGAILALGFLGLLISYISFCVGKLIMSCGCIILMLYEYVTKLTIKLPYSNVIMGKYGLKRIVIYYGIIGTFIIAMKVTLFLEERKEKQQKKELLASGSHSTAKKVEDNIEFYYVRYAKRMGCLIAISVVMAVTLYQTTPKTCVKVIDVGQGDSIFIQSDNGKTFLIDAGSSSKNKITKYCILPFLKANGVREIDYLIMTHSDQDHINGMMELLNYKVNGKCYVRNLIVPDIDEKLLDEQYVQLVDNACKNHIPIIKASDGLKIKTDEFVLTCINPLTEVTYKDKNDCALAFIMNIKSFSMLLTGDISNKTESQLVEKGKLNKVDVLKVAHHGSDTSSSNEMLNVVKPEVSIVSCALKNRYGHPGKHTIERLEQIKSMLYYTMRSGQISIYIKKKGFLVETFLN